MFSLLVVFLATEPNLFKKESLGNMVTVEAESHHKGVEKKTTTPKFKLLEWGSLCSLSLLSSSPLPSCVRARERERKRERRA